MSKLSKSFALVALLLLAPLSLRHADAATCPHAIQIAEATPCVQTQIQPLRDSGLYKETDSVTDNGNGTFTVTFVFTPKCANDPTPCGLSTKVVTATVNCSAGTATCP